MKRTGAAVLATLATVVGMTGCGAADAEWRGTVRDSAGVTIVSNAGTGVWGAGEGWQVVEELRIGTAEGEAEHMFGQVSGVDVDADGRIYVVDQQAREVRVFDSDGTFLRRMGRGGSGPGELSQMPGPVFVGPDGVVAVPDLMNQRINLYSPDGEPAGSTPLLMQEGTPVRWIKDPSGDLVQQAMVMAFPGMDVEPKNVILRRDPRGVILDTLLVMPAGETMDFAGGQPRIRIFSPEPAWAYLPDGRLVHGNSAEYRLLVRAEDGTLTQIIQMEGARRPVTAGDQDAFRREMRKAWAQVGIPPQQMDMMMQTISFADFYPAYMILVGGPEGTLWVQEVQTPETVEEMGGAFDIQDLGGPSWDVFHEDGRFLGRVRMPTRFAPFIFQDDYVYGVARDDMDVQYVARMRIVR